MAWDDMIGAIKLYCRLLGKEFTEADLPVDYSELKRLHDDLKAQAKGRKKQCGKIPLSR